MNRYIRVLIIEDSEDDALLLLEELEQSGYEPSWKRVETRPDMVASLRNEVWDIVLSDYVLPRFSGLEALRTLKESGHDIPFIIVSGKIGETTAVELMKTGAHDYLEKGNLGRLAVAVERELREAGDRQNRRKGEEALKESEERYRFIFDGADDGVFIHGLSAEGVFGNFTEVNEIACQMLGYTREELLRLSAPDTVIPESAIDSTKVAKTLLEDKHALIERVLVAKDGRKIPVEINAHLFELKGNPTVLSVVRDVSERKKLEAQYLRAQKMEAVGRLAGGIAHDFNNLLTPIVGYAELLMMRHKSDSEEYGMIETIKKTGERAARLTRQLLLFSRKAVAAPAVLDLNGVMTSMSKMLPRLVGEDVEYFFSLAPDLKSVKVDESQLEQVILNLAVNAREAMPKGGKLSFTTGNKLLDEDYCRVHPDVSPGLHVMLSVSDTGVGMTPEIREHIFEPFFTTKRQGTGLGLSTVYGIVEQAKGAIHVDSVVGKGTTFSIYLPAICEQEIGVKQAGKHDEGYMPGGNETVLLVEDDTGIREFASQLLTELGYNVLVAASAEEAMVKASEHGGKIDILLTDIILARQRGDELAIRLVGERRDLKVLCMSGYTGERIEHSDLKSANFPFLSKPFSASVLARKVREVLDVR